jgi:hypothetical protein
MRRAELHKKDYEALKAHIVGDIWFYLKEQPDQTLDMSEEKGIPALVINSWDDNEVCETLDELRINDKNGVTAIGNCMEYCIEEEEYDIEKFEVPFLTEILDSVEKHVQLIEEKKK